MKQEELLQGEDEVMEKNGQGVPFRGQTRTESGLPPLPGQGTLPKPVSQEGVYHFSGPGATMPSLFSMGMLLFLFCHCVLGVGSGADDLPPP